MDEVEVFGIAGVGGWIVAAPSAARGKAACGNGDSEKSSEPEKVTTVHGCSSLMWGNKQPETGCRESIGLSRRQVASGY
ncbi:hypothetical protein QTN24_19305 [Cupriavidus sp. SZY C1]|uniref:hypothetical protein n=1 Tax=Cupriavidus sp. SZY C1 TaxID=3055037 RepID=UPI0028B6EB8C|nr:hypothetical protein [Cupriavidus sp. SZY C1]MDT6963653.1 hypothetical protein [Cupriavidus sp. SZY C1]